MTKPELVALIKSLAARRPVFHSEADFQLELALAISRGGAQVRLEKAYSINANPYNGSVLHLDILCWNGNNPNNGAAIELKYPTRKCNITANREVFSLGGSWGTNLTRFDFLNDYRRVGLFQNAGFCKWGYAVILTNEPNAWNTDTSKKKGPNSELSIHEGRKLYTVPLNWRCTPTVASYGSNRIAPFAPIIIPAEETIEWHDYGNSVGKELFRFAVVGLGPSGSRLTKQHINQPQVGSQRESTSQRP